MRRRACRGRGSKTRLPSFPASLSPPPPGPSPSLHRKLLYQALFFQPSPRSSLKLAGNRPPHPSSSLSLSHFFSLSVRETLQGRNFCAGKTSRQDTDNNGWVNGWKESCDSNDSWFRSKFCLIRKLETSGYYSFIDWKLFFCENEIILIQVIFNLVKKSFCTINLDYIIYL